MRLQTIVPALCLCAVSLLAIAGTANAQRLDTTSTDVLVVGGTPSGVAAAIAAARRGESVTLVSATSDLGGLLTGAALDQWDLNVTPAGVSVERGIFSEIYDSLGDAFEPQVAERFFVSLVG